MSEANDKGWILHSLAQARRFGPMSEDDLRGYFSAGMVKSVDRLTAPGEFAMRSAAEVAQMLGVPEPAGPPPPEVGELPTPLPSMAAGVAKDVEAEARAAKAAAAANIDIAAMMAANASSRRRSPGWLLPVLAVVVLVVMLIVGLGMLRKIPVATAGRSLTQPSDGTNAGSAAPPPAPAALVPAPAAAGPTPAPAIAPAAPAADGAGADAADFEASLAQARKLKDASDWPGLQAFSERWVKAQPDRNEPLQYLSFAYSSQGNFRQAADVLQKLLARIPGDATTQALLGEAYLRAGRGAEAAALYGQLVAKAPQDARLWNNYGAALNVSGQSTQAAAALENAVRLDPTFKPAWANLGNLYQSMGDPVRAAAARANAR